MLNPLRDMRRFPSRKAAANAVLVGEPSRRDLDHICGVLNSKRMKGAVELRRLVTSWLESGPNLKKMLHADHLLWRAILTSWASLYLPTSTGRARIELFPEGVREGKVSAQDEACELFAALTLNPECDLLAGPCARCGLYYLKKRRRQKIYCSQKCGSAATARAAVAKKRLEEHVRRLHAARLALSSWKPTSPEQSWKEWVSKHTGLSVHWLSRAANRGDLSPHPLRAK